jgi:hypothetical protein
MSVEEVQYSGDYKDVYTLTDCQTFTCLTFNEDEDTLFLDDEGLINGKEQAFFRLVDTPSGDTYPLVGKALVLGCNEEGESVEPKITLEGLRKQVQFIPALLVRQFV